MEGSFRASGKMNPEACVQKWLSTGDFADGRWNADLNAWSSTCRFDHRRAAELHPQRDAGRRNGRLGRRSGASDIPLTARNIEDGANWIQNLTLHHTPGYTTAEEIKRLQTDLMQSRSATSMPIKCRSASTSMRRMGG